MAGIKIHKSPFSEKVYIYELGCYSEESGPLSHREEHATKKAAIAAARELIKSYKYIELTLLQKDDLGYIEEGNVIETYYKRK